MNDDLLKKLSAIPEEAPDDIDLAMIHAADQKDDTALVSLENFKKSVDGYNGKILLRIPRSLHRRLAECAQIEGVSLNQYALYKLSRPD